MRSTLTAILLTALFPSPAALAGEPAAPPAAPATAVLIPAEIDLGTRAPGSTTRSSLWVCNTADEPLSLVAAKGSCGCTGVDFKPTVLAAGAALQIPFRITASKSPGRDKTVTITVRAEEHPPLSLKVRLRIAADGLVREGDVIAEPRVADLGPVTSGSTVSTSVHLVNAGKIAREVTAVRAACSCTTFPGFARFDLEPSAEGDVDVEVEVPADTAGAVTKDVTFFVADQRPITVPLHMVITHPLVEALERRLEKLYSGTYVYDGFTVKDDVVTAVAWTPDRSRPAARITCRFDELGSIVNVDVVEITPHNARGPA